MKQCGNRLPDLAEARVKTGDKLRHLPGEPGEPCDKLQALPQAWGKAHRKLSHVREARMKACGELQGISRVSGRPRFQWQAAPQAWGQA